MSRLFYALWPDADVVQALQPWVQQAHACYGGRPMRPDTLHLTLAFLGEVPDARLPALQAIVHPGRWSSGPITLDYLGRFRGPRIVWAGPREPVTWLNTMQADLIQTLKALGIPLEGEAFRPHVSLLRKAGAAKLAQEASLQPVIWTPRTLRLVASMPQDSGSTYRTVSECRLEPGARLGPCLVPD